MVHSVWWVGWERDCAEARMLQRTEKASQRSYFLSTAGGCLGARQGNKVGRKGVPDGEQSVRRSGIGSSCVR